MTSAATILTRIPLSTPGHLYRSPMPFGHYDMEGRGLDAYSAAGVSTVILLARRDECMEKTGRDLLAEYQRRGFAVVEVPAPDFGVPDFTTLNRCVKKAVALLERGDNLVAHCHAGIGRTGLFVSCVVAMVEGVSATRAIEMVREVIPGAVERPEQRTSIENFVERRLSGR